MIISTLSDLPLAWWVALGFGSAVIVGLCIIYLLGESPADDDTEGDDW